MERTARIAFFAFGESGDHPFSHRFHHRPAFALNRFLNGAELLVEGGEGGGVGGAFVKGSRVVQGRHHQGHVRHAHQPAGGEDFGGEQFSEGRQSRSFRRRESVRFRDRTLHSHQQFDFGRVAQGQQLAPRFQRRRRRIVRRSRSEINRPEP